MLLITYLPVRDDVARICVDGDLDRPGAAHVAQAVLEASCFEHPLIHLELLGVTSTTPDAVAVLRAARQRAADYGSRCEVVADLALEHALRASTVS